MDSLKVKAILKSTSCFQPKSGLLISGGFGVDASILGLVSSRLSEGCDINDDNDVVNDDDDNENGGDDGDGVVVILDLVRCEG